jgi:hypothetical protein
MSAFRFPTFDELRAMERLARRARNRELARLARLGLGRVASLAQRLAAGLRAKRVRHT